MLSMSACFLYFYSEQSSLLIFPFMWVRSISFVQIFCLLHMNCIASKQTHYRGGRVKGDFLAQWALIHGRLVITTVFADWA